MEATRPGPSRVLQRLPAGITAAAGAYLLVATTVGFSWLDSWHDEQRAAQVVLLGAVAVVTAVLALARPTIATPRFAPAVLLALALGAVSSLLSDRPLDSLAEVSLFGLLCALAATVAVFAKAADRSAVLWLSRCALLIAAAHVVGALTRYAAAVRLEHSLGVEIWLVGFSNPRVASSFYALLIPFVATSTLTTFEPDRRLRVAAWISLVGLWTVAMGLEARALWLSYGVALPALVAVAWSPATRRLALTLVATALIGVLLQHILQLPLSSDAGTSSSAPRDFTSLSARDVLWRLAFEATLGSPLLGIGPGQFSRFESYAGAHPHNWVLQLASEWGLLALLAALIGLLGLGRRLGVALRDPQRVDRLLTAASLSVLVALVSALVDGTLVMPTTQVLFALTFGLMIGCRTATESIQRIVERAPTLIGVTTAAAVVAAALMLAAFAMETYRYQPAEKAAFQKRFPGAWLVPRFWENGLSLVRPVDRRGD